MPNSETKYVIAQHFNVLNFITVINSAVLEM